MSAARLAAVAGPVFPLVSLVAACVGLGTGEARLDSYVFGSVVVTLGCASVALFDAPSFPRRALAALWVVAMPFVAGAATGLALALVHPRVSESEQHSTLLGGMGRGLMGAVVFYPALVLGAVAVQLAATWVARRVRAAPAAAIEPDPTV